MASAGVGQMAPPSGYRLPQGAHQLFVQRKIVLLLIGKEGWRDCHDWPPQGRGRWPPHPDIASRRVRTQLFVQGKIVLLLVGKEGWQDCHDTSRCG